MSMWSKAMVVAQLIIVMAAVHGGGCGDADTGSAVSCGEVEMCLIGCMDYLTQRDRDHDQDHDDDPTAACCNGLEYLQFITPTPPLRQAACECLKEAATGYPDLNQDQAASLPAKCHLQINFTISPTINLLIKYDGG
ncbi:non-specific lipid-transfer protein A-like [Ziziphus jujuba]|uniref:Non-specific lipid-transfer protein A-like n=1 Tax=Ziziphus jujuba TaxID=326968 RepID=A0A6P4A7D4_ZIZJJ|nr:non-specific lipid-transfer protein A-like [Ziziphus jujuba]